MPQLLLSSDHVPCFVTPGASAILRRETTARTCALSCRTVAIRRRIRVPICAAIASPAEGSSCRGVSESDRSKSLSGEGGIATSPVASSLKRSLSLPSIPLSLRLSSSEAASIFFCSLSGLISSILQLLTPFLFGRVLDAISFPNICLRSRVLPLIISYCAAAVARFFEIYQSRRASVRVSTKIRSSTFNKVLRSDMSALDALPAGDALARLSGDTEIIARAVSEHLMHFGQGILEILIASLILGLIAPRLAPIAMIAPPASVLAGAVYGRFAAGLAERLSISLASASGTAADSLSSAKVVKSFAREDWAGKRYEWHANKAREYGSKAARFVGVLEAANRLAFTLNSLTVIAVGAAFVRAGQLSVGRLLSFALYANSIMLAATKASAGLAELLRAEGPARRIQALAELARDVERESQGLEEEEEEEGNREKKENATFLKTGSVEVEFRDVWFSYDGSTEHATAARDNEKENVTMHALRGLNVRAAAGSCVGLVGKSGAGKSTTLSLLCRFYDATRGSVLLNGIDVRDVDLQSLRKEVVGIVSQQAMLYNGSIRENIAFGKENATEEMIIEAATRAGVMEFANELPQGLEENTRRLSGGQMQRVNIARCLLKNAAVMVFDEPSAALDPLNERMVNESIANVVRERRATVLLISHRLQNFRLCDEVFVLQNGRVLEHGSFEELQRKHGEFAKMLNAANGEML